MPGGLRIAVCAGAVGRRQGPEAGLAGRVLLAKIRGQVRVDMWKRLGVWGLGHCRRKCPGGAGDPGVTDSSCFNLQMVKLRGRAWLPCNI